MCYQLFVRTEIFSYLILHPYCMLCYLMSLSIQMRSELLEYKCVIFRGLSQGLETGIIISLVLFIFSSQWTNLKVYIG